MPKPTMTGSGLDIIADIYCDSRTVCTLSPPTSQASLWLVEGAAYRLHPPARLS